MADSLFDMYLGGSSKAIPTNNEPQNDGSLFDMYLSPKTDLPPPTAKITVRPVIGNRELTDADLAGTAQTTPPEQPTNMLGSAIAGGASNIWENVKKDYLSGVDTMVSGINEIGTNKSASGLGKFILGGLSAVPGSLLSGAIHSGEEAVTELTGSPEIGKRAGLLASALPVSPIGLAANAARPVNRAMRDIVSRIGEENIPEIVDRLKANPRLTLMDVSPPVLSDAQGLASKPDLSSSAQLHLSNFVKDQTKTERGVVEKAYNDVMGPTPNVKQLLDNISAEAKKTGATVINPAIKGAGPVDLAPVLQHIEGKSKPGINSVVSAGEPLPDDAIISGLKGVRKYLTNDKQQLTDPQRLHNIQSALRSKAENLMSSSSGQDRLMGYELMTVRNKIVDAIDKASGPANATTGLGPYKTGLSQFRGDKAVGEALEEGTKIFKNGGLESRPEFFEDKIPTNPAELKAMKIGARIAVDNQIRGMRFAARRGENIPEVEFNAEKLGMLFGKKEVAEMQRILSDEKSIAERNQRLFKGSDTASRLAGQKAREVRAPTTVTEAGTKALPFALMEGASYFTTGKPLLGLAAGLTIGGAKKGANLLGRSLDKQTNLEYAKLASATGQARQDLIDKLESLIPVGKPSVLNRISTGVSKLPILRP